MKKVLFVATVVKTHIMVFHLPYIEWFKKNGFETHVCARNDFENKEECIIPFCDQYYDMQFERSPFKSGNLKAYHQLKIIIDSNDYEIIHCHTPIGGVLTRLAAREARKKTTMVIYTAHGFHFFKGAPWHYWLIYYPVERWLARYTDVLITINKEDYARAKSFKAKKVSYVSGVGVDTPKFTRSNDDRYMTRKEIGIPENEIVLLSVGELIRNKNQEVIIKALGMLNHLKIIYVICGTGVLEDYLKGMANKLCVDVRFMGFRKDMARIYSAADLFVISSFREGLSVSLIEAMAAGLPVIGSKIRGNTDLVEEGKGGYLVPPLDIDGYAQFINKLVSNKAMRERMGNFNIEAVRKYDLAEVKNDLINIYQLLSDGSNSCD